LYRCVLAVAEPAVAPRYATEITVAAHSATATLGMRRMKTTSVCTAPSGRDLASRAPHLTFLPGPGNHHN
jgi:hypothetical protein